MLAKYQCASCAPIGLRDIKIKTIVYNSSYSSGGCSLGFALIQLKYSFQESSAIGLTPQASNALVAARSAVTHG